MQATDQAPQITGQAAVTSTSTKSPATVMDWSKFARSAGLVNNTNRKYDMRTTNKPPVNTEAAGGTQQDSKTAGVVNNVTTPKTLETDIPFLRQGNANKDRRAANRKLKADHRAPDKKVSVVENEETSYDKEHPSQPESSTAAAWYQSFPTKPRRLSHTALPIPSSETMTTTTVAAVDLPESSSTSTVPCEYGFAGDERLIATTHFGNESKSEAEQDNEDEQLAEEAGKAKKSRTQKKREARRLARQSRRPSAAEQDNDTNIEDAANTSSEDAEAKNSNEENMANKSNDEGPATVIPTKNAKPVKVTPMARKYPAARSRYSKKNAMSDSSQGQASVVEPDTPVHVNPATPAIPETEPLSSTSKASDAASSEEINCGLTAEHQDGTVPSSREPDHNLFELTSPAQIDIPNVPSLSDFELSLLPLTQKANSGTTPTQARMLPLQGTEAIDQVNFVYLPAITPATSPLSITTASLATPLAASSDTTPSGIASSHPEGPGLPDSPFTCTALAASPNSTPATVAPSYPNGPDSPTSPFTFTAPFISQPPIPSSPISTFFQDLTPGPDDSEVIPAPESQDSVSVAESTLGSPEIATKETCETKARPQLSKPFIFTSNKVERQDETADHTATSIPAASSPFTFTLPAGEINPSVAPVAASKSSGVTPDTSAVEATTSAVTGSEPEGNIRDLRIDADKPKKIVPDHVDHTSLNGVPTLGVSITLSDASTDAEAVMLHPETVEVDSQAHVEEQNTPHEPTEVPHPNTAPFSNDAHWNEFWPLFIYIDSVWQETTTFNERDWRYFVTGEVHEALEDLDGLYNLFLLRADHIDSGKSFFFECKEYIYVPLIPCHFELGRSIRDVSDSHEYLIECHQADDDAFSLVEETTIPSLESTQTFPICAHSHSSSIRGRIPFQVPSSVPAAPAADNAVLADAVSTNVLTIPAVQEYDHAIYDFSYAYRPLDSMMPQNRSNYNRALYQVSEAASRLDSTMPQHRPDAVEENQDQPWSEIPIKSDSQRFSITVDGGKHVRDAYIRAFAALSRQSHSSNSSETTTSPSSSTPTLSSVSSLTDLSNGAGDMTASASTESLSSVIAKVQHSSGNTQAATAIPPEIITNAAEPLHKSAITVIAEQTSTSDAANATKSSTAPADNKSSRMLAVVVIADQAPTSAATAAAPSSSPARGQSTSMNISAATTAATDDTIHEEQIPGWSEIMMLVKKAAQRDVCAVYKPVQSFVSATKFRSAACNLKRSWIAKKGGEAARAAAVITMIPADLIIQAAATPAMKAVKSGLFVGRWRARLAPRWLTKRTEA